MRVPVYGVVVMRGEIAAQPSESPRPMSLYLLCEMMRNNIYPTEGHHKPNKRHTRVQQPLHDM